MTGTTTNRPFLAAVRALLPEAGLVAAGDGESAPDAKGAYALLIRLSEPVPFTLHGCLHRIEPGCYIYAGSARGPGGIRARLRHHLRHEKRLHWHIDHLTIAAARIDALTLPGGSECAIVARLTGAQLTAAPAFHPPVPGFGSSDCHACASHLLRWLDDGDHPGGVTP